MALRIAVLCSDEPHHAYMVAALRARFAVQVVVVEPGAARLRRLRQRGRWLDWMWARYHAARRSLFGLAAYRRARFALPPGAPDPLEDALVVDSINDPAVGTCVHAARPHVTVVIGTSILGERTLARLGPVVLNLHGGYLPHYRGNHCFFFALYDGAFDRIGCTIHFIDRGVDTGDVVSHVIPRAQPGDTPETLYCRAEAKAIAHLIRLLERYEDGGALPRSPQPGGGRTFRTRDRKPHHDVLFWLRRRSGRLTVPARTGEIRDSVVPVSGAAARPRPSLQRLAHGGAS
jgi:hypothetical protein